MSEGGSIFRVIREGNDAFEGTYPGPKHEETFIRFDESAKNDIFETANGTTREKVQRKNEADVEALFKESEKENIGSVFEKQDKLDEQPRFSEKPNNGLGNINWGEFYDESDTMDSNEPHLFRQAPKPEDLKFYYHDTKDTVTEVKGLDLKEINEAKAKLETQDQKIKGPSFEPSFGILK